VLLRISATSYVLALPILLFCSVSASAQQLVGPPPAKYFVHAGVVLPARSQTLSDSATFSLYDETARFDSAYDVGRGGGFEIGGGAYVWNNVAVGVTIGRVGGGGDARVSASLPHPVLFGAPRSAQLTSTSDHSERAVHVQALWTIPIRDRLDVTVGAGPSFYSVRQELVTEFFFSEGPEPFRSVTATGTTQVSRSESAVGLNLGVDGVYMLTPRIGAGLTLRYSGASVDLPGADGQEITVDAGGFQAAFGIRLRF
jgi:Outer membrane protein beta-barrel domain